MIESTHTTSSINRLPKSIYQRLTGIFNSLSLESPIHRNRNSNPQVPRRRKAFPCARFSVGRRLHYNTTPANSPHTISLSLYYLRAQKKNVQDNVGICTTSNENNTTKAYPVLFKISGAQVASVRRSGLESFHRETQLHSSRRLVGREHLLFFVVLPKKSYISRV